MLQEAKETKSSIIAEAKGKAKEEAQKIVTNAQREIENAKKSAIIEIKNQVGNMAIEIAEKLIQKELKSNTEHEKFVNKLVDDIKLN